jgi:para-aminobenzoate synthetase component 1
MGAIDLLRATFPGGSITGAPKIRSMEIIDKLEAARRGPYCGSIGWLGADGALDANIAIRTIVATPETLVAHAGGGIVYDSDPTEEYQEMMVKAGPLLVGDDRTQRQSRLIGVPSNSAAPPSAGGTLAREPVGTETGRNDRTQTQVERAGVAQAESTHAGPPE